MIVADTDVLIDYLAGQGRHADRVAFEVEHGDLRTTAVTRFELLAGARTPRQLAAVSDLLAALPTLPLDEGSADEAAAIRRELESRGEGIGVADSLIAGTVRHHDGVLLTRNLRHFARVAGLALSRDSL